MANRNPSPSTRFQPGKSGNPGGRPRGKSLTSKIRELLDLAEMEGVTVPSGKVVGDVIAAVIVKAAAGGSLPFVQIVLDRTEGKVPDSLKFDDVTDKRTLEDEIREISEEGRLDREPPENPPKQTSKGSRAVRCQRPK